MNRVITGSELAPFCTTSLLIAVLPIEPNGDAYRIISSQEAQGKGFSGLGAWLVKADRIWKEKQREKADKMDIYKRLDYSRGLSSQSSRARYKVLYNTSETYLVSCVIENGPSTINADLAKIRLSGVLADAKTYRFDTNDFDEALFVCALLNTQIVDSLIKPMQSRGHWGERDIHKKVLELPLPKFNPKNKDHLELVKLAKEAQAKASKIVPELERRYSSIGKIRQVVKSETEEELLKIDKIVRDLISETVDLQNGLDDYL